MSEEIRKMINKIKTINQGVNDDTENLNTLYHGSKFLFNKFDIKRVNTGQHSQDFGYGHYFTSDKNTGRHYANELSNTKTPIDKYNDIIKKNKKNDVLLQYLIDGRVISAKRILNELIQENGEFVDEWIELLKSLDIVQRYGFLYTVNINNGNFITKDTYEYMKQNLNLNDKEIANVLLKQGYNGIKYKIKSFGSNNKNEYNVVIFDDNIIDITQIEKLEFDGILKLW